MLSNQRMSIDERRKYLKLVAPRYAVVKRRRRSELLTEVAVNSSMTTSSVASGRRPQGYG